MIDPDSVGEVIQHEPHLNMREAAAVRAKLQAREPAELAGALNEAVERVLDTVEAADVALQRALNQADWVYDPVTASKDARTYSRPKNAPPHWVRCDFVRDGVRCVKGEGHEKGVGEQAKHEGPKS